MFAEDASLIEIASRLALTRVFAAPNLFDQSSISDSLNFLARTTWISLVQGGQRRTQREV